MDVHAHLYGGAVAGNGLFVAFGSEVDSTQQAHSVASIRVHPGTDGRVSLFQDDEKTYAQENEQTPSQR